MSTTVRLDRAMSVTLDYVGAAFTITVDAPWSSAGPSTGSTVDAARVHELAAAIEEIARRMDPPHARRPLPFDPGDD